MSDYFSEKIENAIRLASYWHQEHKIADTEFDYFTHCASVGFLLSQAEFDEEIIVAGICHDLLNFSNCPEDEISTVCGAKVAVIVKTLTENKKISLKENWKERKMDYIDAIKNASNEVKAVVAADRIVSLQVFMDVIGEKGLEYFNKFWVGPEEKLWFEDNLCMMLNENWKHGLAKEYDKLLDEFVELLEEMNEDEDEDEWEKLKVGPTSLKLRGVRKVDFDAPENKRKQEVKVKPLNKKVLDEMQASELPVLGKKKNKQVRRTKGLYLDDKEYDLLLPAALQLGIMREQIDNKILRDSLKINYLIAFKILKELKRLQVIKRADSTKPRKVSIKKAREALETLSVK